MNFWFTEEQEKFRQEIIDFCKTEPRGEITSPGFSPSFYNKVADKGWFGLPIPREYGGLGRDAIHRVIFMEEMAYWRAPILLGLYGRSMSLFGNICLKHGSEAQKKEYLPKLASGELIFGQTYTEPEAGTDLAAVQTRALRDGDYYIINGQKTFITGEHKYTLLMARTDPNAPPERGISFFILDNSSPGMTSIPMTTMAGTQTSQLFLEDVKVPAENRLGEENRGWNYYMETKPLYLNKELGATVGVTRRALDELVRYVKETTRERELLSRSQLVRHKLAELATDIKAMRLLIYKMAWMQATGLDVSDMALITRVFDVETRLKFSRTAMRLLGLSGQLQAGSKYAPLGGMMERMYRGDALQLFTRGSPSYTKTVIATHTLGLPES